jgi:TetR/AcrR family transcriptional regulator, cholesterol catabolism regulator
VEIKNKIIETATGLFRKYGIRSVTMDEIAKELAISKKTIYQYFKDKDDIVATTAYEHFEDQRKKLDEIQSSATNSIEELFMICCFFRENVAEINPSLLFDLQKFHPKAWDLYLNYKESVYKNSLLMSLERGVKEGCFRPEINIEILAVLRQEQIQMSFDEQVYPRDKFDFTEVQMQLFMHFVYGIVTPKGKELMDKYFNSAKSDE